MEAKIVWKGEALNFEGQLGSGYIFDLGSGDDKIGGSPMEFLLAGVAGCTAVDIVGTLKKQRQKISGVEVAINGVRATEHPKVYTDVDILYSVRGQGVTQKAVERAISLSKEKYCSASVMFQQAGVNVRTAYELIED